MTYVPLHLHSQYSLLDGLGTPKHIVQRAKELGLPAVALTDHGVLYGAVEFFKAAKKAGIKPIIGCEMYIAPNGRFSKKSKDDARNHHAIFLAENMTGYQNLMALVTKAHTEGYYYKPRVDYELMREYHEGIIVLSGCINGEFADAAINRGIDAARTVAQRYVSIFGAANYFFELQYHPELPAQAIVNEAAIALSRELSIPLVVTGDSHYIKPEQREAHDALLCVGTGSFVADENRLQFDGNFHLHEPQEVAAWFPDYPEAVENTLRIAERCSVALELGVHKIPKFKTPAGESADVYLRQVCEQNFKEFPELIAHPEALARLNFELSVIHSMGFDDYFLIVWDLVKYAKDHGMLVGPGRGSAAGSLVSYVLRITTINPLQYGLIFERFLNPERISMPDIDIDFPPERRDEVLTYVRNVYGHDNVAQIITFGTMKARAAIRDVGRVLGMPYGEVDRVAKLVPGKLGITLREALDQDADFAGVYEQSPTNKRLIDLAIQLEGVTRHASTHACAVVISEKPLITYTPLQLASKNESSTITQYHMKSIEDLGLLKMDFLGLSNLAIIETTLKIIKRTRNLDIDLTAIPLNDERTYQLLSRGDTTGVFQLESAGMKRYLRELKPTELEDIIAMVSLYRPGPMDFIPDYIAGKAGNRRISYLHPVLKPILERTYGIAVYQEQILEIAQKFAGFTLGEADVLRRAIGKKIRSELEAQRDKFILGAVQNGIERDLAIQMFKFIEPFANYGFNKSHAAGYAMIAYQTAYLKANYPVEFMAALLTSEHGNTDRIAIEIEECRTMGIEVLPPSINESRRSFTVADNGKDIRFGLGAIKNVGDATIDIITQTRQDAPFASLEDFVSRVPADSLNRKVLESFAKSGAFDCLSERRLVLHNVDRLIGYAKEQERHRRSGQLDLFAGTATTTTDQVHRLIVEEIMPATKQECLMWEKQLLGLYVTDHPLKEYREALEKSATAIASLSASDEGKKRRIGGVIQSIKRITTKTGESMLFVELQDLSGMLECVVFPKVYQTTHDVWHTDVIVLVEGKISFREGRTDVMGSEPKLLVSAVSILSREAARASRDHESSTGTLEIAIEDIDTGESIAVHHGARLVGDLYEIHIPVHTSRDALEALKKFLLKRRGETKCLVIFTEGTGGTPAKKVLLPFGVRASDELTEDIGRILSGHKPIHAA